MARIDPPPVMAKVRCDVCSKTESIPEHLWNLPAGWAVVTTVLSMSSTGNTPPTKPGPIEQKEVCPDCFNKLHRFLDGREPV